MDIKILGPGCPKCAKVEERVKSAVAELRVAAGVEKITAIEKILAYGIPATPGLVIDGRVKSSGRIPRLEEIKAWIQEAAA